MMWSRTQASNPAWSPPPPPLLPDAAAGEISVVCIAENMDAGMCAARRAQARRNHLLAGFEAGGGVVGGGEQGEEEYDEPEEAFNDGGVPIEPFHLKRERELGYFDEVGRGPQAWPLPVRYDGEPAGNEGALDRTSLTWARVAGPFCRTEIMLSIVRRSKMHGRMPCRVSGDRVLLRSFAASFAVLAAWVTLSSKQASGC